MAKSNYALPVPERPGPVISTYAFTTTGHKRPSVALGDCDAAGQDLLVELPAHDDPDRGSPIKIGGRGSANPFAAASAANDRVDAWFSLQGQQGVISTREGQCIYDGGRQTIGSQIFSVGATTVACLPAQAGLKGKVLSAHLAVSSFTTPGVVQLNAGSTSLLVWYIAGLGNYIWPCTGYALLSTSANQALDWIGLTGIAGSLSLTWYYAP